jgi:hypothetical protein
MKILLPLIACTCFSLTAMEHKIIPIQPSSNPPAYTPGILSPDPSIPQMIQTFEMMERENITHLEVRHHIGMPNQPPSITITHRSQPSQSARRQRSLHCKCAAAICLIPAAIIDALLSPFQACANEQLYGEDPLSAWSGDTYSAPENYLCIDQCSLTKALLNIACNCNYQTCIECANNENASS